MFKLFINKTDALSHEQFPRIHKNDIPTVEYLLTLNIFLYKIDNVDGNIFGELATRSMHKNNKTARLLRYNIHTCYVSNINAVFQAYRCPNCDTVFSRAFNLERYLTTCSERVKNFYPRIVYQIRENLFDELDSFGINYTSEQKLSKSLAIFDFESICVQEETFRDTNTTKWIGKYVPVPVSSSSNPVEEPIFLCNSDPHHLDAPYFGTLENLASQSEAELKNLFLDVETKLKIKLGSTLEKHTQRNNRRESARFDMSQNDCDNEICASTQFLLIQKNQIFDLQASLERGTLLQNFTSVWFQYDRNLIKSLLM